MYQPSANFVEQMDTRPFRVWLTGEAGALPVDTLEFSAAWCPSSFSLGNANAASFSAEYSGGTLPFGAGDRVALSAELSLEDGSRETVPLGSFVLTKAEQQADSDQWSLAGEDAVSTLLAEEFFCADVQQPPATAPQVLSEICTGTGLSLEGAELVPDTPMALEYDAVGGSGSTMRELVGQIALLAGANALVGRDGVLRLCRFRDTDCQVGPGRYYESGLTLEGEDFVFGALEVTVSTLQQGETGSQEHEQVFTAQLEGVTRGVRFSSQWFDQAAFDGVWQAWQGKQWRPAQIEFLGDLRLDPGDVITVTDRAGTDYTLAVMGLKHSFDGGFRTTVNCYGPAESGSAQPQTVSQAITGLKTDLGRFRRLYADNLEATAAQIKHITTEDIVGQYGTINLAKGTFQFGDALVWDGKQMTIRGVLESEQGTIGGWTIGDKTLYSTSNGGKFKMELKPATDDEVPYIMMQGTDGTTAWITPFVGNYGDLQRLEISCGNARINLDSNGTVYTNLGEFQAQAGLRCNALTIGSAGVNDFVTAQGISGSWTYRKWNSGVAECWGIFRVTFANSFVLDTVATLPFSFPSVTAVLGTLNDMGGNAANALPWNAKAQMPNPAQVQLVLHNPNGGFDGTSVTNVSAYVLGRWK